MMSKNLASQKLVSQTTRNASYLLHLGVGKCEITWYLGISPSTVEKHITALAGVECKDAATAPESGGPVAHLPLGPWQLRLPAGATERITQFCQVLCEHLILGWQRLQPRNGRIPIEKFSKRQKEVLPLLLRAASDAEIAYQLGISVRTVEKQVTAILQASNSFSRSQFIATSAMAFQRKADFTH
jgi:DNA-binding NarL/FixJ family response regulator